MIVTQSVRARLIAHSRRMKSGCVEWTRSRVYNGYGRINVDGIICRAHRVAWEVERGRIPDGAHVLHHCDNPPCINVEHLYLGSPAINAMDKSRRGRVRTKRGSESHLAKLDESTVALILKSPMSQSELATALGVSRSAICHVRSGRHWKHVKEGR